MQLAVVRLPEPFCSRPLPASEAAAFVARAPWQVAGTLEFRCYKFSYEYLIVLTSGLASAEVSADQQLPELTVAARAAVLA